MIEENIEICQSQEPTSEWLNYYIELTLGIFLYIAVRYITSPV